MKGIAFLPGILGAVITLGIIVPSQAQVTSDGTTNTTVNSTGNNFNILNGIQRGGNLFHSFGEFSIPTGGSATFNNSSAIENIINRVTGGNVSNIDGLIKANGSASVFLINPSGIVFGENARLDIGGSFFGSTAESILFEDGFEFSTVNAQSEPLLTISVPLGLQYGTNPSSINVSGANLTVNLGQNLALLGGDVTINNSEIQAPGGQIQLGGLAETGTIQLEGLTAKFPENLTRSNITLENAASINSTSTNGGNITIDAADFTMSGSSELLAGLTSGGSDTTSVAGNIIINATGNSNISEKSLIANDLQTLSVGNGGNIQLNTGSFSLTGGSRIQTVTNSDGTSGDIIVNANGGMEISGFTDDGLFSGILSRSATETSGTGGNITINNPQNNLTLSNRGFIATVTNSSSNGGSIETNLNNLVMETGGQILTATTNLGNAGDITINATESVNISGESQDFIDNPFLDLPVFDLDALEWITTPNPNVEASDTIPYVSVERTPTQIINGTTILGTAEEGVDYYSFSITQGGSRAIFDIDGGWLDAEDGTDVDTEIFLFNRGTGELLGSNSESDVFDSGSQDSLVFPGFTLDTVIDTTLEESGVYLLGVSAFDSSAATNLLIGGQTVQVGNTYTLNVSVENQGTQGVSLPENRLNPANYNPNLNADSGILSQSSNIGNSGNLTINTGELILNDKSTISTATLDAGTAGNITLNVDDLTSIQELSEIFSITSGRGNAGNIEINTERLQLVSGSAIFSSTESDGNAGNINIFAKESVILREDNILSINIISSTAFTGQGGKIEIETPILRLFDGSQITSLATGEGDSGRIIINADLVEATGSDASGVFPSGISVSTQTGSGNGGNLEINTRQLRLLDGAQILSSTLTSGDSGNITVRASESIEFIGQNEAGLASALDSSAQLGSTGNGGDILLETGLLRIAEGGLVSASTLAQGNGGSLTVRATEIEIADAVLDSTGLVGGLNVSVSDEATGSGGDLVVEADRLRVFEGGQVSASTLGAGDAGSITLEVDEIEVTGVSEDGEFVSSISAFSETDFAAGSIDINANNLTVSDRAQITVSNTGSGDAGNLTVNADNIFLNTQGSLEAEVAAGEKGNIDLTSQFLLLRRNSNITTNAIGTANGGNININSAIIAGFEDSDIVANAVEGNGGNINITTQGIFGLTFRDERTSESDITASSQFGVNGTVEINNITIDPNSGLFELPTELTDPSKQIAAGCSSNNDSSFVATGRGGMPHNPNQYLNLNSPWSDLRDFSVSGNQSNNTEEITLLSNPPAIVEATGMIRNENGVIEFVVLENIPLRNKQFSQCSGNNT